MQEGLACLGLPCAYPPLPESPKIELASILALGFLLGMEPIKLTGNFGPGLERADLIEQIEAARAKMSECAYGSEEYYAAKKEKDEATKAHAATFNRRK